PAAETRRNRAEGGGMKAEDKRQGFSSIRIFVLSLWMAEQIPKFYHSFTVSSQYLHNESVNLEGNP
ncbi:MAG: hypothetical protein D6784_01810, partial [Chloroflexi bacterium]